MANPPRKKGTAAESAVVKWLRLNGFGQADRQPLRGGHDQGDITACPGVVIEVKAYRLPTGTPTAGQLTEWMQQTEVERWNAAADVAVLIVKRPGTTDVGRWFAYLTVGTFTDVLGVDRCPPRVGHRPICLPLHDLAVILRAGGWGDPLDEEVA